MTCRHHDAAGLGRHLNYSLACTISWMLGCSCHLERKCHQNRSTTISKVYYLFSRMILGSKLVFVACGGFKKWLNFEVWTVVGRHFQILSTLDKLADISVSPQGWDFLGSWSLTRRESELFDLLSCYSRTLPWFRNFSFRPLQIWPATQISCLHSGPACNKSCCTKAKANLVTHLEWSHSLCLWGTSS